MFIFRNERVCGVNPFHPLLSRKNRPIRVACWKRYSKHLVPAALISFLLCLCGLALTSSLFYSDFRFEVFGLAILIVSIVRTLAVGKTREMYVTQDVSIERAPILADVEFAFRFSSLGIGCLIIILNGDKDYLEYSYVAVLLGGLAFFFALLPIINTVATTLRITRIQ